MVTTTTIIGLVTASVPFMFTDEMEIKPPYGFCGPNTHQYAKGIQIVKMVIWVFVPSLITLASYLKIYTGLKRRRDAFYESTSTPSPQDERRLTASYSASLHCSGSEAVLAFDVSTTNRNYHRAGSRLKRLSRKMLAMLLTKLTAHMPIALFYLLTTRENRDPALNLVVLSLNFASTLFHPTPTIALLQLSDMGGGCSHRKK
ncbi:hypothetical protein RvY_18597 [Ramazzottius varieornatus]|uniref:G-protein coupled receptors family 1 profile domain-containing protein n=1 Tax=Ramazzottius varieornatus TaxID=947166 RepID=A0A1D1W6D1_RAMVA|nr:hypothetical protein RvY_18597 [Ramazzottius varieornatus]